MQIRKIALFSHDGRRRTIRFKLGTLNVLTGDAMTGKSALLDIAEYCLGRSRFNIPAGPISERVAWFGILLQFESSRVWIGRPAPAPGRASSQEAMLEIGTSTKVPKSARLGINSNVREVRATLDRLLGVERFVVPGSFGSYGKDYTASVAHALLFSLQKQSEIASQEYLFHRQAEIEMAESIRNTLPYFLGAVPLDYASKRGELARLQRDGRLVRSDLRGAEERALRYDRDLVELFEQALLLGLPQPDAVPSKDDMAAMLRRFNSEMGDLDRRVSAAETSQIERRQIRGRRSELQSTLARLDDEAFALRQVADAEEGLREVVAEQTRRLEAASVLPSPHAANDRCPVCLSILTEARPQIEELRELSTRLVAELPALEAASSRNLDEQAQLEESISSVKSQIAALEEAERAAGSSRSQAGASFALGRLSEAINRMVQPPELDIVSLASRRDAIDRQLAQLEAEVGADAVADRLASIGNLLSEAMRRFRDALQLEHSGPLRLDLKKLTVVVDSESGMVPLRRVGSGGNWIGYHILSHLALHQVLMRGDRPTPRFLFLDQPSQAYFPVDASLDDPSSSDHKAVRRLFRILRDFTESSSGQFQIIVCDHADLAEDWFQRAIVERWRGGLKLVPDDWPDRAA